MLQPRQRSLSQAWPGLMPICPTQPQLQLPLILTLTDSITINGQRQSSFLGSVMTPFQHAVKPSGAGGAFGMGRQ